MKHRKLIRFILTTVNSVEFVLIISSNKNTILINRPEIFAAYQYQNNFIFYFPKLKYIVTSTLEDIKTSETEVPIPQG